MRHNKNDNDSDNENNNNDNNDNSDDDERNTKGGIHCHDNTWYNDRVGWTATL